MNDLNKIVQLLNGNATISLKRPQRRGVKANRAMRYYLVTERGSEFLSHRVMRLLYDGGYVDSSGKVRQGSVVNNNDQQINRYTGEPLSLL